MFVEVIRPNEIIEGTFGKGLTASSYDILDIIFSKIKNDNNTCIEININDYKKLYKQDKSNIYRDMEKAVKTFIIKNDKGEQGIRSFTYFDNMGNECICAWFSEIRYMPKQGVIRVEISKTLKDIFLFMKSKIYYDLETTVNLNSEYSKRIYYLLKTFENTGWRKDNVKDLQVKLECPKSYAQWNQFKTNVLDVAYEEINLKTDINFEYDAIKEKRKVSKVNFSIKSKKGNVKEIIKENKRKKDESLYDKIIVDISNELKENKIKLAKSTLERIRSKYDDDMFLRAVNILIINNEYGTVKAPGKYLVGVLEKLLEKSKGKNNEKPKGSNFKSRSYDLEKLENALLYGVSHNAEIEEVLLKK